MASKARRESVALPIASEPWALRRFEIQDTRPRPVAAVAAELNSR
jgi:hypothetical protein